MDSSEDDKSTRETPPKKRRISTSRVTSNANEFHRQKLQHMKEEHDLKMEILREELEIRRLEREHRIVEHQAALRNLNDLRSLHFEVDNE